MLVSLQMRDLAIIDAAEVTFGPGLNVVTGETGAGKSILVDALSLALGARGTPDVVRSGANQAEVTALFDVRGREGLRARLEEAGIEWDDELTVRRIVAADKGGGRSRAYLNGRMVSLGQLVQLTAGLADVTSQHEHQSLSDPSMHLSLLDAAARLEGLRGEVSSSHAALADASHQLDALLRELRQKTDREDLLRYQLKEIDEIALRPGDDEALAAERDRLRHAGKLREGAATAEETLYGGEAAAIDQIARARDAIEDLARLDSSLEPVLTLLDDARAQVDEAARMLGRYARSVQSDPERLADLEDTLQKLARLKRKYGASMAEILAFRARAAAELENLQQGESRVQELERAVEKARERATERARVLSAERKKAAQQLGDAISHELKSLGMGGARVVVDVTPASPAAGDLSVDGARLGPSGLDRVEFLIAPNKGEEPRPLRKIASGGELSRALLAVKRVLSEVGDAGMYVFDEVDTGVGGAVAEVIGQKLKAVAKRNQTLVITHLPQIAVYADRHYVVDKKVVEERTVSGVRLLKESERADEIARMLGGLKVTDKTRAAAREMIRDAHAAR
jgi:DNA repair protein RecN (Recombination protein N)